MKKFIILVLVVCFAFSAFACSKASEAPKADAPAADEPAADAPAEDEVIEVGVSMCVMNAVFYTCMEDYFELAAEDYYEEHGVKLNFTILDANGDAGTQATHVTDLINKGCDVIIPYPQDSSAILSSIKECHDAGIPVITTCRQENPAETDEAKRADIFIGLDTEAQAYVAAAECFKRMQDAGVEIKALELIGDLADENAVNRSAGFNRAAKEYGVDIVATCAYEWDAEQCLNMASAALVEHPEINMVFIPSDSHSAAVEAALDRNGMWHKRGEEGHVWIAAQDGSSDGLKYMLDGYHDTNGNYDHWPVCQAVVEYCAKLAAGEEADKDAIVLEPRVITPENIESLENLWGMDYM